MTSKQKNILFYSLLFLVFLIAGLIRFSNLNLTPPGVWYDEAYNGLDAIQAYQTGNYKIFYPENNGREGLYINLIALAYKFFGVNEFSLRVISALFGWLGIVGFYLLARRFKFSRWNVLLVTFLLSTSFWHLNFSRIAFRGIMAPTLLTWSIYFLSLGLVPFQKKTLTKENKVNYFLFILSGLLLGLGLHSYIAFRLAPFVVLIFLTGFLLTRKRFLKDFWFSGLAFLFGALLSAGPLLIYFYLNLDQFVGRADAVSIFNNPSAGFFASLTKSLVFHLGSLFFIGDPNQRHNHQLMALLPPAWSILFGLGFFFSLKIIWQDIKLRIKRKKWVLPASNFFLIALLSQGWFWMMLVPGVLSIEGIPHALRIIGTLPAIFLIILLALEKFSELFQKVKTSPLIKLKMIRFQVLYFALSGLMVIVLSVSFLQLSIYFGDWANHPQTALSFEKKQTDLGKLISSLPLKKNNIILVGTDAHISLDRKSFGAKASEFTGWPNIESYHHYLPSEGLGNIVCQNSLIIFYDHNEWLKSEIKKKCPNLTEKELIAPGDNIQYGFWVLE